MNTRWAPSPDNPFTFEAIHAIRRRWSELVRSAPRHNLKAEHYLLYMALMHRDWRRAFTPVRRPKLLANGRRPYDAAIRALSIVHSSYHEAGLLEPFGGLVTPEMLAYLRAALPRVTGDLRQAERLPEAPYEEVGDDAA